MVRAGSPGVSVHGQRTSQLLIIFLHVYVPCREMWESSLTCKSEGEEVKGQELGRKWSLGGENETSEQEIMER